MCTEDVGGGLKIAGEYCLERTEYWISGVTRRGRRFKTDERQKGEK